MKYSCLLFCFLPVLSIHAQEPQSAEDLINRSIAYHDPQNQWPTFSGTLLLGETRPSGAERKIRVALDVTSEAFVYDLRQDGDHVVKSLIEGTCEAVVNGSKTFSEELAEKYRTSCERIKGYHYYYLYLYGLPMKLKDPGTQLTSGITRKRYQEKDVLAVEVSYSPDVGTDIWEFYFDPNSYAMVGYKFWRANQPESGEYIFLDEEATLGDTGIRIPKIRKWYTNKDKRYLGTDTIRGFEPVGGK